MSYALYLDDCRSPLELAPNGKEWVVARDWFAFCFHLQINGIPDHVTFDHDLCRESVEHYFHMKENNLNRIDYTKITTPTGLDCCKELAKQCEVRGKYPLTINLHSHNKFGLDEMRRQLESDMPSFTSLITAERIPFKYVEELLPLKRK